MSDEMLIESVPWESDESEDSEGDEAFAESEDSDEDYGEADYGEARSSRARRRARGVSRFLPVRRGVNGVRFRGPDGQVRNLPFPKKLATAAETNRGLASQEAGRRALAERLEKLESGIRVQQKKNGNVSGSVYLAIGGGLTAYSLFKAGERTSGTTFREAWVAEETTKMATLASATQVVTSGAKWLINGQYHRSGVGIAADVFSVVQIAAFAFASLNTDDSTIDAQVEDTDGRNAAASATGAKEGTVILQKNTGQKFVLRPVAAGGLAAVLLQ